jgi:carbamoyltransferase
VSVVLGLNAYHADSAACVLVNGRLVAAAEEERFRRVKHWAGLPSEAIAYCLTEAHLAPTDVAHVAINTDPRAQLGRKVAYALRHRPASLVRERARVAGARHSISRALAEAFPAHRWRARVHRVEHHLAHLASAYHASAFDAAVAVSVDGFGDFASAAWGPGVGDRLQVDGRVSFPHSLGTFYQALTQYLGFPNYGDEYKVMGLASYGAPRHLAQMRDVVRLGTDGMFQLGLRYFRHPREAITVRWDGGAPTFGPLYTDALVDLLGPARARDAEIETRHRDIACSVQAMYEEAFVHLLRALHARYRLPSLALAGGCAMNSVANGKITRATPFARVYVQPAAGDAGGAVGAALLVAHATGDHPARGQMTHAQWGPAFDAEAIASAVAARRAEIDRAGCDIRQVADEDALCADAARRLADGQVVGWFQGRMEWGARALGNRSILCDPRRADMRDLLNRKIKRRESFRPFAPSILRERVREWFDDDVDVPCMMQVLPIREEQRALVPAVTHVDGTGRLQTVTRADNPRYHRLIAAFHERTGVPMVLNTSFNENEPIVCTPAQALDCFLRTEMDALVAGDTIIARRG